MFLDNASTTPLTQQVKDYIISLLDTYQNPSSTYQSGVNVRQIITTARNNVAKFINADSRDIIFTSGGSASNTLAIKGYVKKHNCTVLYSPIAHKSILKCIESIKNAYPLKVDRCGKINIADLKEWLNTRDNYFVILSYADSEIGTVQNIKELTDLIHFYNATVYVDCTGSISQIPVNVKALGIDMLGFSGHKLNALKGIGVLYKKSNIELEPLIYGSQEYIINNISNCYLIGSDLQHRLPHNLYICFKGIQGESLMTLLDMNNIQVSTGSACASGDLMPSNTLIAIGVNKKDLNSCIRITFLGNEVKEDLDYLCKNIKKCVETLRCLNA